MNDLLRIIQEAKDRHDAALFTLIAVVVILAAGVIIGAIVF